MKDIIYKTVKPSHLKKLQNTQIINNLMRVLEVVLIYLLWMRENDLLGGRKGLYGRMRVGGNYAE